MREDTNKKSDKNCPDELLMVTYMLGECTEQQKNIIADHVLACERCAEQVDMNRQIMEEQSSQSMPEVPIEVIDKAKALVDEKYGTNLLHINVKCIVNTFEKLKTTGKIIVGPLSASVTPALRDDTKKQISNCLVKQSFNGLEIHVELTRMEEDNNSVAVVINQRSGSRAKGSIRFTLLQESEELESYTYNNQKVIFENVSLGTYFIEVSESNKILGAVRLELIGQGA